MQDGLAVSAGLWAWLTVINPQRKLTNETLNSYGWEGGEMPEEWKGVCVGGFGGSPNSEKGDSAKNNSLVYLMLLPGNWLWYSKNDL